MQRARPSKIPDDAGPLLEWYIPTRGFKIWGGIFTALIAMAYFTLDNRGFEWMADWWAWSILLGGGALMFFTIGHEGRAYAGPDWFRGTRGFVRTYELTEIKIRRSIGWDVMLKDSHGGKTVTPQHTLQQNRDLWDLVYNGIRHSVANGAKVNQRARNRFEL